MSTIIKNGNNVMVKPGRDVVASMVNEFRDELHTLVQESSGEITIDLTGVEMVDSVGIGVIIATHNSLNKTGRKLRVINVSKEIYSLFTTMRLDRHFEVVRAS
ncbi:MAG: STAS domain-containing protein [Desulfobacterales bacterium]|nr:STAS domain-containing protein [Desulfobacterales bacterium]